MGRRDLPVLLSSFHKGFRSSDLLQRFHSFHCFSFLKHTYSRIQKDHRQNDPRIAEFPQEHGDRRRHKKDEDHRVVDLFLYHIPEVLFFSFFQNVLSLAFKTPASLLLCQSLFGIRIQDPANFFLF